jgi:hypothetical protein
MTREEKLDVLAAYGFDVNKDLLAGVPALNHRISCQPVAVLVSAHLMKPSRLVRRQRRSVD